MKRKHINKKTVIGYIIFLIASLMAIYTYAVDSAFKEVMTVVVSLIAAFGVFYQTKKNTDTSKADFILGLQEDFTSNSQFAELFEYCWECFNNEDEKCEKTLENYIENNRIVLLNYLTFFESIYLMYEQHVVDMEILDELFGRRFFIVVSNVIVQELDLKKNGKYYTNVYYLYKEWYSYRERKIEREKYSIQNEKEERQICFLEFSEKNERYFKKLPFE